MKLSIAPSIRIMCECGNVLVTQHKVNAIPFFTISDYETFEGVRCERCGEFVPAEEVKYVYRRATKRTENTDLRPDVQGNQESG